MGMSSLEEYLCICILNGSSLEGTSGLLLNHFFSKQFSFYIIPMQGNLYSD